SPLLGRLASPIAVPRRAARGERSLLRIAAELHKCCRRAAQRVARCRLAHEHARCELDPHRRVIESDIECIIRFTEVTFTPDVGGDGSWPAEKDQGLIDEVRTE